MNYDKDSMLCVCDVCQTALTIGDDATFIELGWEEQPVYGYDNTQYLIEDYRIICPHCVYEEMHSCDRN